MNKKVLIIGSGEMTSYVVPLLLEKGYDLTLTTTKPEKIKSLTERYSNKIQAILLEGTDLLGVHKAMENKEIVIFAVAPLKNRFPPKSDIEGYNQVIINTYKIPAQNIVKGYQSLNQKPKVIFISCHGVYPSTGKIADEKTPAVTSEVTRAILKEGESMILDWIPQSVTLRMGWLLSPTRHWKHTFETLKKHNYKLIGTGENRSNFLHIEDGARSIVFAIENNLDGIYNVCNDVHPSWRDLFAIVSEQLGIEPPQWNPADREDHFEGDHVISSEKIKKAGFVFKYPREMGLSFILTPFF